jgi:hypothetical protein
MVKTILKTDGKGNVISREVIGSPDGVIRIPDEMLPTVAAIIRAGLENQKKGA